MELTQLNNEICSICHEELNGNNICCMDCYSNHFHKICIEKLILYQSQQMKNSTCPLCKKQITQQFDADVNKFIINEMYYIYELNLETKIYSIYNYNTRELFTTIEILDVNLVSMYSNCDTIVAISALINNEKDVVNTIMNLTL